MPAPSDPALLDQQFIEALREFLGLGPLYGDTANRLVPNRPDSPMRRVVPVPRPERVLTVGGLSLTIRGWAEHLKGTLNLTREQIRGRLKNGWTEEEAVTTPAGTWGGRGPGGKVERRSSPGVVHSSSCPDRLLSSPPP